MLETFIATAHTLVKRHGIVGPALCATLIGGSIYGTVVAVRQIKSEWAIIKKNSRQQWKTKVVSSSDP
jgi:hypothetical protein